jgi:hypothetical protein
LVIKTLDPQLEKWWIRIRINLCGFATLVKITTDKKLFIDLFLIFSAPGEEEADQGQMHH